MQFKPLSWAIGAMVGVAVFAAAYVVFSALGTGPSSGLARYAQKSLSNLIVLEAPPPRPSGAFLNEAGEETRLSDFEGQLVLLNLWATWCAPCVKEMPSLDALQARYDPAVFVVLPVSFDRTLEEGRAFYDEFGLTRLGLYNDRTLGLGQETKAQGLPISVLYDPRGRELARVSREVDWASPEAFAFIDAALADVGLSAPDASADAAVDGGS